MLFCPECDKLRRALWYVGLSMRSWIKRLHMYAGLLCVSSLLVYGVVGIVAMLEDAPEKRAKAKPEVFFRDFVPPPNLSDVEMGQHIMDHFPLPLANPIPQWALKRDKENNLVLNYYTVNGMTGVTVLEKEKKLRFEKTTVGFLDFLNRIHATTIRAEVPDLRVRGWIYYNEFSIWAMSFMTISGLYLWLASRPGWRWAQVSLASGLALFAALYWAIR